MTDEGVIIELPTPTMINSYSTYVADLFEISLFITIFVAISIFIRDKTKGVFPLILSKPIKPSDYVLSKYLTFNGLVIASTIIGHVFFVYYTNILFGSIDITLSLISVLAFSLYVLFITSVALLASILMKQYVGALVVTFGGHLGLSITASFKRFDVVQWLPSYLPSHVQTVITEGQSPRLIICVLLSLILTVILLIASTMLLKNKDITTH
jgi:ABC-2 type transport system permease protein